MKSLAVWIINHFTLEAGPRRKHYRFSWRHRFSTSLGIWCFPPYMMLRQAGLNTRGDAPCYCRRQEATKHEYSGTVVPVTHVTVPRDSVVFIWGSLHDELYAYHPTTDFEKKKTYW